MLTIPESTLIFEKDSTFVEVQTKDTLVYQKRPVKVGLSDGVNIEVVKGVVAGEKIKSGTLNQEK